MGGTWSSLVSYSSLALFQSSSKWNVTDAEVTFPGNVERREKVSAKAPSSKICPLFRGVIFLIPTFELLVQFNGKFCELLTFMLLHREAGCIIQRALNYLCMTKSRDVIRVSIKHCFGPLKVIS